MIRLKPRLYVEVADVHDVVKSCDILVVVLENTKNIQFFLSKILFVNWFF